MPASPFSQLRKKTPEKKLLLPEVMWKCRNFGAHVIQAPEPLSGIFFCRNRVSRYINIYTDACFVCMYRCMYICMHACMHAEDGAGYKESERERERTGTNKKRDKDTDRERERECVCVCARHRYGHMKLCEIEIQMFLEM